MQKFHTIEKYLTFDDVLIVPKFSHVKSRKNVDLSTSFKTHEVKHTLKLPIISANMDTVTGSDMAIAMINAGGQGCLHRFWSIEENCEAFDKVINTTNIAPMVAVGVGNVELQRARRLQLHGAEVFVLDVAHAAQYQVVEQYKQLKMLMPNSFIIVGNFATDTSIDTFVEYLGEYPDGIKVGIGPGSVCTTRIKTGIGIPQLSATLSCASYCKRNNIFCIADGGMKNPGDIAKALAAGADAVMLGGMLAGTFETPGKLIEGRDSDFYKKYRGSASKSSYETQNKTGTHLTTEGEDIFVPYKGPVSNILSDIEGGLRSAFAYANSLDLEDFQECTQFIIVSNNTTTENKAHGKN